MFEALKKLEAAQVEFKKQMQDHGATAVAEGAKELFAKYPALEKIRWTQYSPHFNDGDACTFSVHDPEYGFASEEASQVLTESASNYDENNDEHTDLWSVDYLYEHRDKDRPAYEDFKAFSNAVCSLEDALELAFGDGYQITCSKDGSVEVEDYDHD